MYITNNNNCWYTNVGEAFIDIGVKNIFNKIAKQNNNLHYNTISPMSKYYIGNLLGNNYKLENIYDPTDWICPDLFILPGMFGSVEFVNNSYSIEMARKVKKNGGEIAFLGFGACKYNDIERKTVIKAMQELKPLFVITRDNKTYEMYKDFVNCTKGLDCAYWVNEDFMPNRIKLNKEYVVSTFNRSDEPNEVSKILGTIHPWHMQYSLNNSKSRFLSKKNLMISDNPYDYITLYANANRVYTDLVHATIISLLYSVPVKYYQIDNRRGAFESLNYLAYNKDGFMSLDIDKLQNEKRQLEQKISLIIKQRWKE